MSTAADRLKKQREQASASVAEGFTPLVNQPDTQTIPMNLGTPSNLGATASKEERTKQINVELPESTGNRLRVKAAQHNITQSKAVQALIEAWLNNEVNIEPSKVIRPARVRNNVVVRH
jgi:hypothetical protein